MSDTDRPKVPRRDERLPFDAVAEISLGNGKWQRSRLSNISCSGFRLSWLPNAAIGKSLFIRISGMAPLTAVIRHHGVGGIGCEFEKPLSVYVLDHLARQKAA